MIYFLQNHLRRIFIAICIILALLPSSAFSESNPGSKQALSFQFEDQDRNLMILEPEFEKPMIVTVADKKGSEQLLNWIEPLAREFDDAVDFFPIADLRTVPGPLKGFIRRSFRKQFDYDVAMDWDGTAAQQLATKPDQANLILLNRTGTVITAVHGEPSAENVEEMARAIRVELGRPPKKPAEASDQSPKP